MHVRILVFVFFLLSNDLFSQGKEGYSPKVQALFEAVEKAENPRQKWTALGNLLKVMKGSDPIERLKIADQALEIAQSIPADDLILKSLINIAQVADDAGQIEKAQTASLEAIKMAQRIGDKNQEYRAARAMAALFQAQEPQKCLDLIQPYWQKLEQETADSLLRMKLFYLNTMVPAQQWANRKNEAAALAHKGLELNEKLGDPTFSLAFNTQLANLYAETEDFKSAYVYGNRAQRLLKKDDPLSPAVFNVLANIHKCLGNLDSSIIYSQKALQWPNISPSRKASALNELANVAIKQGKFSEAIRLNDAAEKALVGTDDHRGRARIWVSQSHCLIEAGRYKEGAKVAEKAKNYYFELPEQAFRFERLNAEGLYLKARLYAEGNDSLVKDFDAFVNTTDTMHDHKLRAEVEELRLKYEAAENEKTIAAQSSELAQKSLFQKFLIALSLLGIIAGGLGWRLFWAKKRENERIQADWEDLKKENQNLIEEARARPLAELAEKTILLGENGHSAQIALKNLAFCFAVKNGSVFQTDDGRSLFSKFSLAQWMDALPEGLFVRVHHSHAVNRLFVRSFTAGAVLLTTEKSLAVGRAYKEAALAELEKPLA